jgi:hypothetical protein
VAGPIPAHRSLLIAQSLKLGLTLEFAMPAKRIEELMPSNLNAL